MTNELTTKICSSISDTVFRIDEELRTIDNKGIFFAPELHIAFECGKTITSNGQKIWGQEKYKWKRETKFENYGLADLFFSTDNGDKGFIIEFKILQTIDAYIRDIEKLKRLDGEKYERFFCAILGFFDNKQNEHIDKLIEKYGDEIELLDKTTPRETWPINYKGKIFYSTVIWKIK
jgi:hypothetical protein